MSLVESMRRRMMRAEENGVPRDSFIDSELATGAQLQESLSPTLQAIGKEHTLAAMELSEEGGWPTSARREPREGDDLDFEPTKRACKGAGGRAPETSTRGR